MRSRTAVPFVAAVAGVAATAVLVAAVRSPAVPEHATAATPAVSLARVAADGPTVTVPALDAGETTPKSEVAVSIAARSSVAGLRAAAPAPAGDVLASRAPADEVAAGAASSSSAAASRAAASSAAASNRASSSQASSSQASSSQNSSSQNSSSQASSSQASSSQASSSQDSSAAASSSAASRSAASRSAASIAAASSAAASSAAASSAAASRAAASSSAASSAAAHISAASRAAADAYAASHPAPDTSEAVDQAVDQAAESGITQSVVVMNKQTGTVTTAVNADIEMPSMSLVKLILAADVIDRAGGADNVDPDTLDQLHQMIIASDDSIAQDLYDRNGKGAVVTRMVNKYGLTRTSPSPQPRYWGDVQITARDMASLLHQLLHSARTSDWFTEAMQGALSKGADGFDQDFGMNSVPGAGSKQGWGCCLGNVLSVHSVGFTPTQIIVVLSTAGYDLPYQKLNTSAELARDLGARASLSSVSRTVRAGLPPP